MTRKYCSNAVAESSRESRWMRDLLGTFLQRLGLRVAVEGCTWRRFMGDLERLAIASGTSADAHGLLPARRHQGLIPTDVRAIFAPIYQKAALNASPGRPWYGARSVFLPTWVFHEVVADLAWLEHRLGSEDTKHLTVQQAALARALGGELLDILGGVLSAELERRWERRLKDAEAVAIAERQQTPIRLKAV